MNPLYAILLDGGFLTKKLFQQLGRVATADDIVAECVRLKGISHIAGHDLLRIYYYDAFPASGTIRTPVGRAQFSLDGTPRFRDAQSLYDKLVLKPDFALRMGQAVMSPAGWRIKPAVASELVRTARALTDADFQLDVSQKGVDMRVGMDMARLALRQMVRTIIVVTGDSDFVPAFKFVRREGVRVILDPMGHNVRAELRHHADIVL